MAAQNRQFKVRGHKDFFNIFDKEEGLDILKRVKTTPIDRGHIFVHYTDESFCDFLVIEDTPELLLVEFLSTCG
jgi:hypothetical protein